MQGPLSPLYKPARPWHDSPPHSSWQFRQHSPQTEAAEQARERGEDVGWDYSYGVASPQMEDRLQLRQQLTVAVASLATHTHCGVTMDPLLLALTVTGVAALVAPRVAGWLVSPYGDSAFLVPAAREWALAAMAHCFS